ncbi:MAG: hypothetical protein H6502_04690 [Candidatus Woesearchaeota archaeon]|nr:MAG: hypothetical protein H6502_04690 [Candidatus Woesearchaeota archaeon]
MSVELIAKGCPICGGDVRGNDDIKFFCKGCNVTFSRRQLAKHVKTHEAVEGSFLASRGSNKVHVPSCPYAKRIGKENKLVFATRDEARTGGFVFCSCMLSLGSKKQFVASAQGGKYHRLSCPFAKKISERLYFDSFKELPKEVEVEPCSCIKTKKS